jgi:hypothetical protein
MIRPSPELDDLERRYVREIIGPLTYQEALARFAALWAHAQRLDPGFPGTDWEQDLEADLALVRVFRELG